MPTQKEQQVKKVHFTDHHIAAKVKDGEKKKGKRTKGKGTKGEGGKTQKEVKKSRSALFKKVRVQQQAALSLDLSEEPVPSTADISETETFVPRDLAGYVNGWNLLNGPIRLVKVGAFLFAVVGHLFLAELVTPLESLPKEDADVQADTRLGKKNGIMYAGSTLISQVSRPADNLRAPASEHWVWKNFRRVLNVFSREVMQVIATQSWETILCHEKIIFFGMDDLVAAFPGAPIRPFGSPAATYNLDNLPDLGSEAYLREEVTREFNAPFVSYLEKCLEVERVRQLRQQAAQEAKPSVSGAAASAGSASNSRADAALSRLLQMVSDADSDSGSGSDSGSDSGSVEDY